jgi:hypothetical protein
MYTVYKQELKLGLHEYELEGNATILTVQMQQATFVMWYGCNTELPKKKRQIIGIGTGHPIPEKVSQQKLDWIATVQDGRLVWHFFEVE